MSGPLAHADGVTRRFGDFTAVDDVTMTVEAGEIVGLLGANGAGKTTLIRMLLGLVLPSEGTIRLFGRPPSRETRVRLGYVPQGLGLYTDLTAVENLDFVAHAFDRENRPETSEKASKVASEADGRLVADIGLGLQRRLAFEAALGHEPGLLILDEPTSGVDPLSRTRLWDTVHVQAERGVGVLVTTHYMQEAQQCDRLVLMSRGRQVAAGTDADIIGSTTAAEVDPAADWSRAFAVLDAAGLPVTLAGRRVRVADTPPERVRAVLAAAGVAAGVRSVPATLEEKMIIIERAAASGPSAPVAPARTAST
ncbi:ABC-2 type transport system ATP-binding protein/ribosome-dependent ATPase [Actinomadura pelletieri DSM 43383]|uniref:ABC-2 type transport system ATP-binding protein/ribosome-dependent ATPase n=1 Tax=Actinomadura pelletieri DSM 43383 TaxID=1120940 RepID=A0A495QII9_9ACTN|nr:ABC transporter ATP-binding protein [Actinomadura pelletieri]RKS71957.1 ABC-2 type transport system ATP-binding protein/ribosome-dependent ATPase [Actinomadura pelletieri DSM 43383]